MGFVNSDLANCALLGVRIPNQTVVAAFGRQKFCVSYTYFCAVFFAPAFSCDTEGADKLHAGHNNPAGANSRRAFPILAFGFLHGVSFGLVLSVTHCRMRSHRFGS